MRRFIAAAGALCLSAGLIITAPTTASAADNRDGPRAVCQHRLCLFVLDKSTDRDGDGVTDVDEKKLGTNPKDPNSYPEVQQLFDLAIARELPSFESHLTELVVLPRDTPDGKALATGVGALVVPDKGPVVQSVEGLLGKLRSNGFEHLGRDMTTVLPKEPKLRDDQKLAFALLGNVAVWGVNGDSIEGILGATNFGVNGHKKPTRFNDRGFTYGEGPGSFGRGYSVGYADGSWDNVTVTTTETHTTKAKGTITTVGHDSDGNFLGSGETRYLHITETFEDGSSLDDFFSTTTNWDQNGNQTERITVTILTDTSADGSTETTTLTTHYDENDNRTVTIRTTTTDDGETTTTTTTTVIYNEDGEVESSETTETCEGVDCPDDDTGEGTGEETGMPHPDYVGTGPITGDDLARVADRLNSNRTPSQDDYGQIDISDAEPPSDGLGPLILTANADGVVTLAVGGSPFFNRAHPQYDPNLEEVIEISGVTPPGGDPISWPLP